MVVVVAGIDIEPDSDPVCIIAKALVVGVSKVVWVVLLVSRTLDVFENFLVSTMAVI